MNPIEIIRGLSEKLDPQKLGAAEALLSPSGLESLEELRGYLKPRPKYLGPGIWLRAMQEMNSFAPAKNTYEKGTDHE